MIGSFVPLIITVIITVAAQKHGLDMLAVACAAIIVGVAVKWSWIMVLDAIIDYYDEYKGNAWVLNLPTEMLFDKPERPPAKDLAASNE